MKKTPPPASPDAYVAAVSGWRRDCVDLLRSAVRAVPSVKEEVKWGHLIYQANGPLLLIRAEDDRVLFGFWRGQRLMKLEPRLRKGGKYEMATLELRDGMSITAGAARRLAREAVALNRKFGDPTLIARKDSKTETLKKPK